jgi:hypothetical protein
MVKNNIYKVTLVAIAVTTGISVYGASTIDPANKNAYGANIGWVDARADGMNGMVVGEFYCSGYLYSANVGWIHVGDGSPRNGQAYAQNLATDYGVNHDGLGNLTGFAYGANIGWINFEQELGKPQVNLKTGELSGFVWSQNVGWIALNTAQGYVKTLTIDPGPDTDGDGIPDAWEYRYFTFSRLALGYLSADGDYDGDGVSDYEEYLADTDPTDPNDQLLITNLELSDLGQRLTWASKPTRKYNIEYASVLTTNSWTTHPAIYPTGTSASQLIKGGPTQASRFYRVKSAPPLSN